jgi:plasmid maintenance system antidote protein VapI
VPAFWLTNQPKEEIMTTKKSQTTKLNPNNLLDALIKKLHLKNDAALSRTLEVAPPVVSKIRHGRLPVGASMLIRMHELTELSIRELRALMGDTKEKFHHRNELAA